MDNYNSNENDILNESENSAQSTDSSVIRTSNVKPAEIKGRGINIKKVIIPAAVIIVIILIIVLLCVFGGKNNSESDVTPIVTEIGTTEIVDTDGNITDIPVTSIIYPSDQKPQKTDTSADSSSGKSDAPSGSSSSPANITDSVKTTKKNNNVKNTQKNQDNQNTPVTNAPVKTKTQAEAFAEFINSLNNSNYYLGGKMNTNGEILNIGLMFCESGSKISTDFEGLPVELAVVDGKIYMINTNKKTYMIFSQELAKQFDIDLSDFDNSDFVWEFSSPSSAEKSKAEINGKTVDCYTLGMGDGIAKVYFDGNTPKRIDKQSNDGKTVTIYEITDFRGNITKNDLLPSKEYKSQNMLSFMMDMMGEVQ